VILDLNGTKRSEIAGEKQRDLIKHNSDERDYIREGEHKYYF